MTQLPAGVEVIVCSGQESATSDFDDFSTTEALINQGRDEAIRGAPTATGWADPTPSTNVTASWPAPLSVPNGARPAPVPDGAPAPPARRTARPRRTAPPVGRSLPVRRRTTVRDRATRWSRCRAPTPSRDVTAHHPGGYAGDHAVVGEGASDDGPGPHDHVLSHVVPGRITTPVPNQLPVPITDRDVVRPLGMDHLVRILVTMVLVGDVDVRAGVDVITDLELKMADDVATPTDHASVADPDDRVGDHASDRAPFRPKC